MKCWRKTIEGEVMIHWRMIMHGEKYGEYLGYKTKAIGLQTAKNKDLHKF